MRKDLGKYMRGYSRRSILVLLVLFLVSALSAPAFAEQCAPCNETTLYLWTQENTTYATLFYRAVIVRGDPGLEGITYTTPVDFELTPFPYQPLNFTFNYSGASEPIPGCSPNFTNASGIATCTIPESMRNRVAGCVFVTVEYNPTDPKTMSTAATTQFCRGFVPINFGNAWACLPFFIILGLLAASMYAMGHSPVTGFDIFSPKLPVAKKHGFKGEDRRTAWMAMQVAYRRNQALAERLLRESGKKIVQKMKAEGILTAEEAIRLKRASMSDIEAVALKNRAIPKKLEEMTADELRKTLKSLEVRRLERPIPILDERNRTRLLSILRKELRARYQEHFEFQFLRDRAFSANKQGYEKYFNTMEHSLGMLEANRAAMKRLANAYGETDIAKLVGRVPLVGGVLGGALGKPLGWMYKYEQPFRIPKFIQTNVGMIFTERTRNLTQAGKLVWGAAKAAVREPTVGLVQLVEERRKGKLGPRMEKFAKFVKKKSGDTYNLGPLVPKFDEEAKRLADSEPSIIWGKRGPKSHFDTEEDARKGVINLRREFNNREEEIGIIDKIRRKASGQNADEEIKNLGELLRKAKERNAVEEIKKLEGALKKARDGAEEIKRLEGLLKKAKERNAVEEIKKLEEMLGGARDKFANEAVVNFFSFSLGDVRDPSWRFGQFTQNLPATEKEYWLMALGVLVSRSQTGEGKRETGESKMWVAIEKQLHRGLPLTPLQLAMLKEILEKVLLTAERDKMNAELEIGAWKKIHGRLREKYGVDVKAGDAVTLELMRRADADFLSPREKTRYIPRNMDWIKEMKDNEMSEEMIRRTVFEKGLAGFEAAFDAKTDIGELKQLLAKNAPGLVVEKDKEGRVTKIYKDMFMAMDHDKFLTRVDKEKTKKGLWRWSRVEKVGEKDVVKGPFERVPGLPWLVGFTGETLERFMVSAFKPTILEEATAAYETSMTVMHYSNLLHSAYWRGDYSPQLERTRRLWQGKRKHGFEYTWGGENSEFEFDEEKKVFRDVDDHEEIAYTSYEKRGTDLIIAHLPNGRMKIFKKTLGMWNEIGIMTLEDTLRKEEAAVDWSEGRLSRYKKEKAPLGRRLEELQLDGKSLGSSALANASIDDLRDISVQKKGEIKFLRSLINQMDTERGRVQQDIFAEEGRLRSNLRGGYHGAIEALVAQQGHPDVGHNVGKKAGIFGALAGYTVRVPASYGGLAGMGGYYAQGYNLIGYPVSPPSEVLRANFAMGGLTARLLYPTWLIGKYAARMTRPMLNYWFDLRTPEGKSAKEQMRYFDDYGAPLVETEETMRIRRDIAELRQRKDEEARAEETALSAKLRRIIEEGSTQDDVWHDRKGRARIIMKENVFVRTDENNLESFFEIDKNGLEHKVSLKNAMSPGAIAKFTAQTVRNWVYLGYDYNPIFRGGGAGSAIANLVTKPFLKLGVDIPTSMLAPMWAPFDARQYDLHVPVIPGIPANMPFFGMFGSGFRQRESRVQLEKGGDVSPRDTDFVGLKQGAHRVGLSKVSGKVDWENDVGKTMMEKEILKRRANEIDAELGRAGDEATRRRLERERDEVNELIDHEMDKRLDQLDTQILPVGPDRSEALRFAPLLGPSGIFRTYYGGIKWDPQYWTALKPWRLFSFGRPSRVTQGRFGQAGVGGEAIVDWVMTPPSGMPIGYVSGKKLMGGMDWGDAGGFDRGYRSTDTRSDRDANLEPFAARWYINKYRGDVTSPEYERMLVNVSKTLVKREKTAGEALRERGDFLTSQIDFEMQNPSLGVWSPGLYLYGGIRRRWKQAKSEEKPGERNIGNRLLSATPVIGQQYINIRAARAAGAKACQQCNGTGKVAYGMPCPHCLGKKFVQ